MIETEPQASHHSHDEDREVYHVRLCRYCAPRPESAPDCFWCAGLGVELVRVQEPSACPARRRTR